MMSSIKTFFREHRPLAIALTSGIVLILIIVTIIIVIITHPEDDGVEGSDSTSFDSSLNDDYKALSNNQEFGISKYLPIISTSPSYKITYDLSVDETGNYNFKLVLSAYSASARGPMLKRLLSENLGGFDPLEYEIELTNYYNPFTNYSIEDIEANTLPSNMEKQNLYTYDDFEYSVQTIVHTIYDGTTNTYRYLLKNGKPITTPQLFFTYQDLPFIDKSLVKSLNLLD